MSQTTEKAFESYVGQMLLAKGWQPGTPSDWVRERALCPALVTDFIAATQPRLWAAMRRAAQ